MKKLLSTILIATSLIGLSLQAQTNTPAAPPDTIVGALKQLEGAISAKNTNWIFETHGLYAPALERKYGGGIGAFYNVNQFLYSGIRLDYVDGGFVMPSGSAGIQLPIKPLSALPWLKVTPFSYAGIGIPISGAQVGSIKIPGTYRNNNGQATAIMGYGGAIQIYSRKDGKWNLDLVGDRETWSGFKGSQYRVGLLWHYHF